MILFFSKKNDFDVVIFRIFSLYGRFDKNKRFFVDAIRSFLNKKKFIIKTKNQERDYLFVDDGSCILDTEDDCQPDLNEDGLIGVADVLELLSYFGLFCE